MKPEVKTIEELFTKSEKQEELLRLIDKIIRETAPDLNRQLFSDNNISMIGYGEISHQTSSKGKNYPLISLAPQKKMIDLYISAEKDGVPLPQYFIDSFGKSTIGNNCIHIKSEEQLDKEVLKELIRETLLWADLKTNLYGKNSAG